MAPLIWTCPPPQKMRSSPTWKENSKPSERSSAFPFLVTQPSCICTLFSFSVSQCKLCLSSPLQLTPNTCVLDVTTYWNIKYPLSHVLPQARFFFLSAFKTFKSHSLKKEKPPLLPSHAHVATVLFLTPSGSCKNPNLNTNHNLFWEPWLYSLVTQTVVCGPVFLVSSELVRNAEPQLCF